MSEEKEYLSQKKFDELKKELNNLKSVRRKEIAEQLEFAKGLVKQLSDGLGVRMFIVATNVPFMSKTITLPEPCNCKLPYGYVVLF